MKLLKKRTDPESLQELDNSVLSAQIEDYAKLRKRMMRMWYLLYFILPTLFLAMILAKGGYINGFGIDGIGKPDSATTTVKLQNLIEARYNTTKVEKDKHARLQ